MRFGLVWDGAGSPVSVARRAEESGYSTLLFPDHTGMLAPLPAMGAAAAVTSRIRLGTQVVNIAFRPLHALAQELAAIDLISDGRLDAGLGAGASAAEVESLGLAFPSPASRVRAVAAALDRIPRLFAGATIDGFRLDPLPPQGAAVPLLVGGNGSRLLRLAAARASTVQFTGFSPGDGYRHFSPSGLADRVAIVRSVSAAPSLSLLAQWAGVVPDPSAAASSLRSVSTGALTPADALASPFVLLGTSVGAVVDQIHAVRAHYGISYITVFDSQSPDFHKVIPHFT
jgi:probable F420-dependent oxidoreductase